MPKYFKQINFDSYQIFALISLKSMIYGDIEIMPLYNKMLKMRVEILMPHLGLSDE